MIRNTYWSNDGSQKHHCYKIYYFCIELHRITSVYKTLALFYAENPDTMSLDEFLLTIMNFMKDLKKVTKENADQIQREKRIQATAANKLARISSGKSKNSTLLSDTKSNKSIGSCHTPERDFHDSENIIPNKKNTSVANTMGNLAISAVKNLIFLKTTYKVLLL